MPLPLLIGGAAVVAGLTGVGTGIRGGVKMKEANDTMKEAQSVQEKAVQRFEANNTRTTRSMDALGKYEMEILSTFQGFSDVIEKIQGRPEFKAVTIEGVDLPKYEAEELKKVSTGAGVLLGGLGGAAAGTAGGFAAAGATTTAVLTFGTASTGAAIADLTGVAAANAGLAALGGGSIAAGGGGMALGTAVLGGATLGVGLLVGGVIFNFTGSKLSDKADEAYAQAQRTKKEVDKAVKYLEKLRTTSDNYYYMLQDVNREYRTNLDALKHIVNYSGKVNWSDFTEKEKKTTENTVLLVGLLFKMCQVKLVLQEKDGEDRNIINAQETDTMITKATDIINNQIRQ